MGPGKVDDEVEVDDPLGPVVVEADNNPRPLPFPLPPLEFELSLDVVVPAWMADMSNLLNLPLSFSALDRALALDLAFIPFSPEGVPGVPSGPIP